MKLRMKLAYSFTLLIAYSAILHCFSASALDFFKGKLKLSGDGAWTRVDFPSRLTQPAVFLGTPNYIGEFMLIPQVGTVDAKGFTARVVVPSCLHADLTGKTIVVPYLALPQTVEGDFLAMTARLNRDPNAAEFDTKKHAYAYRSWDGENAEYIVFVQIQNMADILDQATEDVKTPYAFAVADGKLQNKYVHFRMSAPISSTSSFVRVAILVLGGSAASYFGDNPIELKNQYLVTSGEAISHRLDSRVLAFIQPYYTETGYGYALKDSDDSSSITPLLTPSCTQSDQTYSYASYLLMISDDEGMLNAGPNCEAATSTLSSLKETCREACIQLWSWHQSDYMECQNPMKCFTQDFSSSSHLQDVLGPNFSAALTQKLSKACSFETKPNTSPLEQYKFEDVATLSKSRQGSVWSTDSTCGEGAPQLVQVLFSDEPVLRGSSEATDKCGVQDVTEIVRSSCERQRSSSSAACSLDSSIFDEVKSASSCATALNPSLLLRYNCDPENSSEATPCRAYRPQQGDGSSTGACSCPDSGLACSLQDALGDMTWTDELSSNIGVLVGDGLKFDTNTQRFVVPDASDANCSSDSLRILCRATISEEDEGMMNPTPICEEAFSTRNTESSFEDQLCKATCTHLLQGVCSTRSHKWACVHEHLTDCYVPNSLRKTCAIREASNEYNPRFKTCGCAGDPTMEPCTVSEVENLKFDWAATFKATVEGKGGLLLLRNQKVMGDTGLVYTDEAMTGQAACGTALKYQGIFCRVDATVEVPERGDLEPKCRGARSTDKNISNYQCAHACVKEYNQCKKQTSTSAAACFAASQHGHEILSKCDIPLEVQDIVEGESNMIASTVTITTEWERVTFPTQIAPNPVVFTGILHPLGTFGQVQITDVTESGFSIRLALDYCREGYAAAYAKVSWLAMSERPYKVSESGAALRVGTMVVRVDKRTEFLPGVKLNSSAPILLTQIQDIPSDLSMEDIPFINITQVDGTYARISLKSTTATPKQESFTVGFLYMDEVHGAECLTGCKLNNLAVEATSFELHTESDSPGSYREEHFSSRSPLIFGSIILPQDDGKRMLADVPGEDVTDATWAPKVFVVTNDTCEAFEFKEAAAGTLSSRVALLLVQAHLSTEDEENVPDFIPNCEKAKLKEGASGTMDCTAECTKLANACSTSKAWDCFVKAAGADLKRNCYVEPYVETGLTVTSSTTLPPVAETVKCRVVDMSTYPYSEDIGWNVHAMSCFCPQGFDPCTPAQVEQDRAHWLKDVSLWGELCRTYDNVQPIAWGFMQVTYDICMVKTNLKWQKRPYPLYSFDDIFLNGYLNRSGYNQCAEETPFVFCPTASLTTATTTVAPTWDWPENADCLPGSWEEWSDCSATCTPSDPNEPLPVRRRRRAQLLPARGRGAPCVLEETVPCTFESPTPCDSLCRHSEWSQWSECTEKSLDFGVIPVTASSREKHVFAESGGACAANRFREFDSSRCSGMEGPSSVQAGAPSALQVEAEASATTKAELWSEWSSCDAPCLSNGHRPQRYKLSLRTDAQGKQPAYEDTQNEDCPDSLEPCRKDRDPSCDGISPQHDVPENQEFCWQSCRTILKSCEEEAKLSGTTALQCLVTNIQNNQTLRGKCLLPPELEKEAAAPTCFASFARANDDESSEFRFLDPRSDTAQCLCLTANSVPCTAAEVFQSRQLLFEPLSAFACPLQDEAGAIFDADTSGSADSKLFFAAADSSKIFCPISSSKRQQQQVYNATYSTFATAAEMNEYCANGLPAQLKYSSSTPYDVGLDCEGATPKVSSVTAEDCKAKCLNIKQSCSESSANFLSCIATKRQTTDFDKECAAQANVIAGKGIVFCKLVPRDCEYSEWGEWSECSSTCRRGPGATANSVRVRSRQIIQASSAGGAPCKFGSSTTEKSRGDGGTVETEVCTFQELCEDLDQENSLAFTPKPEPSLQLWSSDTTTTTSTEPTVDSSQRVICNIVDMSSAQTDLGYDAVHRTCKCPHYTRPCSRAEAELSKSSWNQSMMTFCQKNGIATIPVKNFELFSCETRTFRDDYDFNEFTAHESCLTDQFSSVFCVEAVDVEAERRQVAITLLLMLAGGTVVGILLVLWFIQYSVDVQKVLGLAGRYVELVNLAKE